MTGRPLVRLPQTAGQTDSEVFFDAANTKLTGVYQPAFGLTNVRLTYAPLNAKWNVAVWGKNLADTQYFRNIAVAGVTGLQPKGTRPIAHTSMMGVARIVLLALVIIFAYLAYRARSGG